MTPSPVHARADALGLPVATPRSLRDEAEAVRFTALDLEAAVVVGYGLLLPQEILQAPRHGCFNLHPSLLPRWRGAAPIQRPILAGDSETAAAIMRMEEGLDTGPIALERRVPVPPDATAGEMHDRLAEIGAALMVEALAALAAGRLGLRPQADEGVVYAGKIDKAEARIDWSQPAQRVHDLIRGLSPFPGAFVEPDLGKGPERLKVLRARRVDGSGAPGAVLDDQFTIACGEGAVQVLEVQRAGKAPMSAEAFLRGVKLGQATRL